MEARIRAELVALFEIDDQGPAFINNAFRALFEEVKHVDPVSQDALSSAFYVVLGEAALRVRFYRSQCLCVIIHARSHRRFCGWV